MNKKVTFKKGDKVKVIKLEYVVRVGYPKNIHDFREEVQIKYSSLIGDLMVKADMPWYNSDGCKVVRGIENSLALGLLIKNNFGGNERSIHRSGLFLNNRLQDEIAEVVSKRIVRTGVYKNQKLTKQKSHVLIKVRHSNGWIHEFEAENLEKIKSCDLEKEKNESSSKKHQRISKPQ